MIPPGRTSFAINPQQWDRIWLKTQHIAADGCIEGLVEGHRRELAFAERHVGKRLALGARSSHSQAGGRSIDAHDLPGGPDQIGGKEGDVTSPATDIEDTHARRDAGLDQELPGDGVDELRCSCSRSSSRSE